MPRPRPMPPRVIPLDIYLPFETLNTPEGAEDSTLSAVNRLLDQHGAIVMIEGIGEFADEPALLEDFPELEALAALGGSSRYLFCSVEQARLDSLLADLASLEQVYARVDRHLLELRAGLHRG